MGDKSSNAKERLRLQLFLNSVMVKPIKMLPTKRPCLPAGRKIALIILFFFLISSLLAKPIQAFYTPNSTYQFQFENAVYKMPEEMNLQSFVYEVLKATIGSVVTAITSCLTCEPGEGDTGMIQTITSFMAFIYATPPASGVQYLADLGRRMEIVQPTYAQEDTIGFSRMKPYRDLWTVFRNMTYVFFVLILVFIGFAIMFRVKISPQTVITIQSALPKVVIALILITFSYAIVGLLIDFMFVANNLIISIIIKTKVSSAKTLADVIGMNINFAPFTSDVTTLITLLYSGYLPISVNLLFFLILPQIGTVFGMGHELAGFTSFFLLIIMAIAFLIALIRVLWTLLKAYVMVVINLIFAPLQILIGVLPGSNAISNWIRNLLANLAVLPIVLAMTFLSCYLTIFAMEYIHDGLGELMIGQVKGGSVFNLIQISNILTDTSNFGRIAEMVIPIFISLGLLLLTPKVADMIKSFFAGKPFEYGTAIGEAIGVGGRPLRAVAGPVILGGGEAVITKAYQRGPGVPASASERALRAIVEAIGKKVS